MASLNTPHPQPPTLNPRANPCITRFGPGPDGWRCGSCANLRATAALHCARGTDKLSVSGIVYTCSLDEQLRSVTSPCCAFFVEAPLVPQPTGAS